MRTETGRRFHWAGYLSGFAFGGFFDGILLHQILQWHHLLSAIDGDIRFQVAADGYFHALMYGIAAIGLWLLATSGRHSNRLLLANVLIGFGVWHVIDAVLSHWLLGIHRIRMDSDNRLLWDLLWLGVFGILPLVAGWMIRRSKGGSKEQVSRSSSVMRSLVGFLVLGAGIQALRPPPDSEFTTVLFAPGIAQAQIFAAIEAVDGRLVWTDRSGELVVIRIADERSGLSLFRHGAIIVSGAGLPPGCFDYLRT